MPEARGWFGRHVDVAHLSPMRWVFAAIGTLVLVFGWVWRFVGETSNVSFLVEMGNQLGPTRLTWLSHWGWLISTVIGLLMIVAAVRRVDPAIQPTEVTLANAALALAQSHDRTSALAAEHKHEADDLRARVNQLETDKAVLRAAGQLATESGIEMGKNYGALIERYAGLVKFSQDLLESHRVRDGVIRQIDRILRDGITTEEQRGDAIVKLVTVLLQFYDDPKSIPEIPNVRLLRALQTAEQSATNDEASSAEPT